MADKNVIRMYKVFDDKITDKTPLYSPYVTEDSRVSAQQLGKEYTADKLEKNNREPTNIVDPEYKRVYYERNMPHQGFSAFGMADPKYSFAPVDELIDTRFVDDDAANDKEPYVTTANVPDFAKDAVTEYNKNPTKYRHRFDLRLDTLLDSFNKNGYDMSKVGNIYDLFSRLITSFDRNKPIKNTEDNLHDLLFQMDLGRLDATDIRNKKAPVFVLASTPESSLISADDAYNDHLTKQRDTMHELITKKITPYKIIDFDKLLNEAAANDEKYKDGDWSAEELFYKHGIVPGTLVSDECMKDIHDDMSNDYKHLMKQRNISNTIADVSRF